MSGASRTACKPARLLALLALLGALCTTAATGDGVATATAAGASTRGGGGLGALASQARVASACAGTFLSAAGHVRNLKKLPEQCMEEGATAAVRCVRTSGRKISPRDRRALGCNKGKTQCEARALCEKEGLRLPSNVGELKSTQDTGCGYDDLRSWTSESCKVRRRERGRK